MARVYRSRWWRRWYLLAKTGPVFRSEHSGLILFGAVASIFMGLIIVLAPFVF